MSHAFCSAGARAVGVLHAILLGYCVAGVVLALQGSLLGWKWVRRAGWRRVHAAVLLAVCALNVWGVCCPLTAAQDALRACAGRPPLPGGFVVSLFGAAGATPAGVLRAELALLFAALVGLATLKPEPA